MIWGCKKFSLVGIESGGSCCKRAVLHINSLRDQGQGATPQFPSLLITYLFGNIIYRCGAGYVT